MPIIPLISPDTAGPLGVKHLPRLWLKARLAAAGELPPGYKDVRPGFDYMALEGLGIDPDSARDYLLKERPTYLQFEAWIGQQPGVDLSPETVAAVNRRIVERLKEPESRQRMIASLGLPADFPASDSIMLNNLDDWRAIDEQLSGADR